MENGRIVETYFILDLIDLMQQAGFDVLPPSRNLKAWEWRTSFIRTCNGTGRAGVTATHTGDYLDCPATGRPLEFNGLDFWKLENDMYVENWVFVDMIHLFRQFGIDLFERIPRP